MRYRHHLKRYGAQVGAAQVAGVLPIVDADLVVVDDRADLAPDHICERGCAKRRDIRNFFLQRIRIAVGVGRTEARGRGLVVEVPSPICMIR